MEREKIKKSIYAGMSIYKAIENKKIVINHEPITHEDKKYISLYLGLLDITNICEDVEVIYESLSKEEYLEVYKNSFVEIIKLINFDSLNEYLNYILSKDIINLFNEKYEININKENKQLVKK